MTLACTEGIYLVHPGCSFLGTKAAENVKSAADPPQQQAEQTAAMVPKKLQPGCTKYIPSVQANVIEDEGGE